ncbi:MAG: disulfide bond formation protein B [Thiothrix sp.]|uniref:disulfide bond formation protein B n=1 Tax=Thiothrix sp. TaxID=1032 RepID=UPI00261487FE|nr:disulfide bond formation protein B [Thiothrix sp.]MDD5391779.1 disulfide bond formation protein B [Thiothrix sp.]
MLTLPHKTLWLTIGLAALSLVIGSFALTALLGLHPCYLCIFQRLLFMLIAVFGLLAASGVEAWIVGRLVFLLAGTGTGTASYQTWLQLQPPGSASCAGSQPGLIEQFVYFLSDNVPSLFAVSGLCEDEELVILGLSLANWALVSFSAALIVTAWILFGKQRSAGQA